MARKSAFDIAKRATDCFGKAGKGEDAIPIWLAFGKDDAAARKGIGKMGAAWLDATGWKPSSASAALVPDSRGGIAAVVAGIDKPSRDNPWGPFAFANLAGDLPAGLYEIANPPSDVDMATLLGVAWAMGAYSFTPYKSKASRKPSGAKLVLPDAARADDVVSAAEAVTFGRDLINTPANDMGPDELEAAAVALAKAHDAKVTSIVGDDLLENNFPLIHAVGRASPRQPRLVDIRWKPAKLPKSAPRIVLVGKGICFDTGGLDLKPAASMLLMKKDMGGAAATLALAHMIMSAGLAVDLRILLAIAENSVAGNAFRPGDVLTARDGSTVEIHNTDAEGRLVLADALSLADEDTPDDIMSFATLTGAARVALGPELPPLYSTDDGFAAELMATGLAALDPVWHMPFWQPYERMLSSPIADINHAADSPFAGSITAALFLKRFVKKAGRYTHLDIYGWAPAKRAGYSKGGEPHAARAVFAHLRKRHGTAAVKA